MNPWSMRSTFIIHQNKELFKAFQVKHIREIKHQIQYYDN